MLVTGQGKRTSSSFSGRPFSPPLGSCLSASHHPSVDTSIRSNRSRIASAAVHTHTACVWEPSISGGVGGGKGMESPKTHLARHGSRHLRCAQIPRQSYGMQRDTPRCACGRGGQVRREARGPTRHSIESACRSRRMRRLQRCPRAVVGPG